MLASAKWRSKRDGLPFNLTAEFLQRVCEPGTCAYCHVPVLWGQIGRHQNGGELDKVDPALGYVKGNVMLACSACNQRKGDLLPIQLRMLADMIEEGVKDRLIRR